MQCFDTIVAGVGGMGSAALYHLARRGRRVLGVERFTVAHDRGSSHGQTRIIRKAYFEHPDYVPLLHQAYRLWRELEAEAGCRLFSRTGLLLAGPAEGAVVTGVERAAQLHGLDIHAIGPDEYGRRFPGFRRLTDGWRALYEPDAGYLAVEDCVRVHVERALVGGAELVPECQVLSWSSDGQSITLGTTHGKYSAASLVICGGAWSDLLLPEMVLPLEVRRKVQLWISTLDDRFSPQRGCPVFGFETPEGFFYGFPEIDRGCIKVAIHSGGETVSSPDLIDRAVHSSDIEPARALAERFLSGLSTEVVAASVCMYTMTPDEHFVIDFHRPYRNVVFAAGFSGHGFKFAPIVGSILADLVIEGRTSEPIEFLSAGRAALSGPGL